MSELERLAAKLDELAGTPAVHWYLPKIAEVAAEIRALAGAGGWRPIREAPMDGTRILILHEGMTSPIISWVTELDVGYYRGSVWQPLPTPPAVAG